jgi:hypothetical protein
MTFKEANRVVHPVEKQWHYPKLIKYGFIPETKSAVGFVRAYTYVHPSGRVIKASTGANADHWEDMTSKSVGSCADLEPHCIALNLK